jgi:hypothetical protein
LPVALTAEPTGTPILKLPDAALWLEVPWLEVMLMTGESAFRNA